MLRYVPRCGLSCVFLWNFGWVVGVGKLWSYHTVLLVPFIFSFSLSPLFFSYFPVFSRSLLLWSSFVSPSCLSLSFWLAHWLWECKLRQTADMTG